MRRVPRARLQKAPARAHWIVRTAFDIGRKRAESPLLTLRRRPSRPFCLATDRGHAGPGLSILAHDRAVADLVVGNIVENTTKERVEQAKANGRNHEQIQGCDVRRVVTQEGAPDLTRWITSRAPQIAMSAMTGR